VGGLALPHLRLAVLHACRRGDFLCEVPLKTLALFGLFRPQPCAPTAATHRAHRQLQRGRVPLLEGGEQVDLALLELVRVENTRVFQLLRFLQLSQYDGREIRHLDVCFRQ
jgi:hypothetical protein